MPHLFTLDMRTVTALSLAVLFAGLLAPVAVGQGSSESAPSSAEITYERGDVVRVPAPVGFDPASLGMGRPVSGGGFSAVRVLPRRTTPQDVNRV